MKIPLTIKNETGGPCCAPMAPAGERNPTLHIDIGPEQKELLAALGTEGTARIHYEVKNISVGNGENGDGGHVCLEIESIEPLTEGEDPEEEEEDDEPEENLDATQSLDKFMKSLKKTKGGEKPQPKETEEEEE